MARREIVPTAKVINWFNKNRGHITYSMGGARIGTDGTADCSGSITIALKESTGIPYEYVYNTVTLGGYLTECGYARILIGDSSGSNLSQVQDEDIILLSCGSSMADSGGAGGHTGVVSGGGKNITSTCYYTNGGKNTAIQDIALNKGYLTYNGFKYYEIWRPLKTVTGGEVTMQCVYWKPNPNGKGEMAYYFNGVSSEYIPHPDSVSILKTIYKDNNGKSIPEYHWQKSAPWWIRLEDVCAKI